MTRFRDEDLLQVLACDPEQRPPAPGADALARFVTAAWASPDTLVLAIDEAGRDVAEAFVAAEQVCCAGIGWQLESAPQLRLRITASGPQLKVLSGLVPPGINIEEVQ